MTYAYDALDRVRPAGRRRRQLALDVAVIGGAVALALALGAATMRRRTA